MKIAFLPIDNRPVCYTLPELTAKIDNELELFLPERKFLGDLTKSADISAIFEWLESLPKDIDAIILTLDTIAYGGLIPSRRSPLTFDDIRFRVEKLKNILEKKQCKVYAFSSIMRISNNNINQEEKEYWSDWGKKIFEYSYNLHKFGHADRGDIPEEVLNDYLSTRRRNFEINKMYLEWQKSGLVDTLVFSKDDCAQFGLNVKEAQELESMGAFTKTGADEIPLSLLSRAIEGDVRICPIFLEPDSKDLISNYEDVSIESSVKGQIELAGCKISDEENADLILYINNFKDRQGEIVMKVDTEHFNKQFSPVQKPFMIADVRFANGSDNAFVEELFKNKLDDKYFYGYSAWNTSANTLGSLICGAKIKFLSKSYNKNVFKKLQVTRFLDDWAYQANVRQKLTNPDVDKLKEEMIIFEKNICALLGVADIMDIKYSYPWNRLFEVEIELS